MLGIEQIAQHMAARRLISLKPDEQGAAIPGIDMRLIQKLKDIPPVRLRAQLLEHGFLPRMIVGDGIGAKLVERQYAIPVTLHQHRADGGELQPLFHHTGRHAEAGRDILVAQPLLNMQRMEGVELVGGMHGCSHFVFREADFEGVMLALQHTADRLGLGDFLALRAEQLRQPPPFADGDEIIAGRNSLRITLGLDHRALQQPVRRDGRGECLDMRRLMRHPAGIARGFLELVERNKQGGAGLDFRNGSGLGHDALLRWSGVMRSKAPALTPAFAASSGGSKCKEGPDAGRRGQRASAPPEGPRLFAGMRVDAADGVWMPCARERRRLLANSAGRARICARDRRRMAGTPLRGPVHKSPVRRSRMRNYLSKRHSANFSSRQVNTQIENI